jgi:AhpD family alkylhydroperoxidase
MPRIDIPDGPGGDGAMVWSLRPEMAGMVDRMIATAYQRSKLPAAEREPARMRIAQLNACDACATFRAPSVIEAGVTEDVYAHLDEWRTWPGYSDRQRLAIEYAERFATDHRAIDDEILDLTLCCAVFLGLGRTLEVLGITDNCPLDI